MSLPPRVVSGPPGGPWLRGYLLPGRVQGSLPEAHGCRCLGPVPSLEHHDFTLSDSLKGLKACVVFLKALGVSCGVSFSVRPVTILCRPGGGSPPGSPRDPGLGHHVPPHGRPLCLRPLLASPSMVNGGASPVLSSSWGAPGRSGEGTSPVGVSRRGRGAPGQRGRWHRPCGDAGSARHGDPLPWSPGWTRTNDVPAPSWVLRKVHAQTRPFLPPRLLQQVHSVTAECGFRGPAEQARAAAGGGRLWGAASLPPATPIGPGRSASVPGPRGFPAPADPKHHGQRHRGSVRLPRARLGPSTDFLSVAPDARLGSSTLPPPPPRFSVQMAPLHAGLWSQTDLVPTLALPFEAVWPPGVITPRLWCLCSEGRVRRAADTQDCCEDESTL